MPLAPKPRPGRPARPVPPAAPAKKPLLLYAGIGSAVVAAGIIAAVVLSGKKEEPAPAPVEKPKPKAEPEIAVRVHHLDLGREIVVTVLLVSSAKIDASQVALLDDRGKEHAAEKADPIEHFRRDYQRHPGAQAFKFRAPAESAALELRSPAGKRAVYRKPGREAFSPLPGSARYEDWTISAAGAPGADSSFDLEIRSRPAEESPAPLDPKRFLLVTDRGEVIAPEVRGTGDPLRLRYAGVPKATREIRLQTSFRDERPAYLFHPWTPKEEPAAAKPDATPPKPEAPKPGNLRADFEAKRSDPVAALKFLAEKAGDEARALAREALARVIQEDVAAGLKAFAEKNAEAAERHLARAALLADPYAPELSRQLLRMLFLLKQPRRFPTGCGDCRGAGSAACGTCQAGLAAGPCPRCETKGHVACLLCDGSGNLDHHGYKGAIVFTISNDFRARNKAGQQGTMHAQKLTWQVTPCAGGGFQLNTESVANCSHFRNQVSRGSARQSCADFWWELKMNVFNGRARIQVPNPKGQLATLSPASAKRFFADYEVCKGGRVTCDRCTGRKTDTCSMCAGKGKAQLLCTNCEGTSQRPCASCKGYGDASWLGRLLPAAQAPTLSQGLTEQALALRDWLDERARREARRDDLARRLDEAKKGLDPSARLTPDFVEIACPRCKGNGSDCEECWASGRREYFEGTAHYERYALVQRLQRQLREASNTTVDPPALAALARAEPATGPVAAPKPVVIPDTARRTGVRAPVPGTVDEMIKLADAKHLTGKQHLEKAKDATDQAVWMDEAVKALNDLKEAQTLYATAQEKLDEMGIAVPRELLDKFRTNMQALVMARRTAP